MQLERLQMQEDPKRLAVSKHACKRLRICFCPSTAIDLPVLRSFVKLWVLLLRRPDRTSRQRSSLPAIHTSPMLRKFLPLPN